MLSFVILTATPSQTSGMFQA